jgi:tRNA threonylcarbamoyl adenosine modification protein YeaZ
VLLLAFDTATPAVTVALFDGSAVLAESSDVDARRHGELLAPAIAQVLAESGRGQRELTGIAVGVGPGPFTGLRVGLMTARALGAALALPVHGVCTLDVLAYATQLDQPFGVATDARRKEVYWARYTGARSRVGEPMVDRPATAADQLAGLPVVGAGAALYLDDFPMAREPRYPSAGQLARLAAERLRSGGAGLLEPLPLYLRRPDAVAPGPRKQVTPA